MTQTRLHELAERIQQLLDELGGPRGIELHVVEEETKFEDDWLYVCVSTPAIGVRVSDYAEMLSEVEKQLRAESVDNVLLVPAHPG